MAAVHILDQVSINVFNAVTHIAMPTGNNSVGTAWKTCYLASFGGVAPATRMTIGSAVGNISSAEAAQVAAGDVIEVWFMYGDDPSLTSPQRQAAITAMANRAAAEFTARFSGQFKYYGYTQ